MWRKLTESDLVATLSAAEVSAYKAGSFRVPGIDPVEALLSRTAELVRGYVRANGRVRLSRTALSIPESLISPAADYAAFDILKRLPTAVGEDRRRARDEAIALFEKVASGAITPEGADDPEIETASLAARSPAFSAPPVRIL